MQVSENVPLRSYNTFGISAKARYFSTFSSADELQELTHRQKEDNLPQLILGGGSNILFTRNFDGYVLKNQVMGIEKVGEDDDYVYVKAGAGENWHGFVKYCLDADLAGVENLSLIPGNVGASPMQNIGAYGAEIKDVFHELEAFHLRDQHIVKFTNAQCEFGYRESVFKKQFKGQFAILNVTYRLNKTPRFNTSYGAIYDELEKMKIEKLTIQAISQAVINIRTSKLPDPAQIGNAGSFFKNPTIPRAQFQQLEAEYPKIVAYPTDSDHVKLAAGWLIEQCGWKGYRLGDAGVHIRQALVLVNYGNASGKDVYDLSQQILESVQEKFGVLLEREVNII
ncbi:UDP-N-acetylmuramate dehydrogenase [Chitinophaga terrae (ex Kim and Jung 2007)]|uniref:UDP-N-acetylenolpyruvoylglucosamine reductase n=1 Tax=Chitinophaga terrae (ex Kim and Jung 2007) TaxID=408074 RepID=A0A1H4E419_9BACT|nr:UDP-N-acetylmuramate dehydrogenase [Chitinophaga terrae (ex Kim and Jung 2007)]MDQ0108278.1 UDP-N-acetylmuramate dehydrogenase [Chitinophaga terrae (ex Kim and Jung 2007)]GEP91418.1 UDP-N-acetylenolpyruvoylglucosamine reductase [Chitinophaga terrae (ex Kim and Jung 2007)]SEA79656.1 UDP-N-acetylmuramate dehydrogenase [Chitinophaga terrae (ex Kim and Jung 2007)]